MLCVAHTYSIAHAIFHWTQCEFCEFFSKDMRWILRVFQCILHRRCWFAFQFCFLLLCINKCVVIWNYNGPVKFVLFSYFLFFLLIEITYLKQIQFIHRIPEFWKQIESNLGLDPKGIQTIKELLTLLEYTTIQSITKLDDRKKILQLEKEFIQFKKSNPDLVENYPNLSNLMFCSGFASSLVDIAKKVKSRFIGLDPVNIESTIFNELKAVWCDKMCFSFA